MADFVYYGISTESTVFVQTVVQRAVVAPGHCDVLRRHMGIARAYHLMAPVSQLHREPLGAMGPAGATVPLQKNTLELSFSTKGRATSSSK